MPDPMQLKVTARRKIFKYAEGANPETDEPMAVEEKEVLLTGKDAEEALAEIGMQKEQAIKIAQERKNKNGIN